MIIYFPLYVKFNYTDDFYKNLKEKTCCGHLALDNHVKAILHENENHAMNVMVHDVKKYLENHPSVIDEKHVIEGYILVYSQRMPDKDGKFYGAGGVVSEIQL